MPDHRNEPALFLEIALTLFLIAAGGLIYAVAQPIPDNAFEPLGARFAPVAISLCLIGLCVLNLAIGAAALRRGDRTLGPGLAVNRRFLDCALMLVCISLYVWVVSEKALPFTASTCLFVTLSMALLFRNLRKAWLFALIGLALGFAIELLSSTVFYIDI